VQTGQLKVVFMDFPLAQLHPNAPTASAAALCVAEQSPVAFWEMHAMLFETQDEWANLSDPNTFFTELAAQTDVELRDFEVCLSSGSKDAVVEETFQRARDLGFSGTPSFQFVIEETGETAELVGAQPFDRFATWIDSLLAGEIPAEAESQAEGGGEIPYWATAEGLAPDPDRPGYTMAGDQYRGSTDAEVVVIEYSDFQCPYCARHVANTQPVLDETFVDTGQVRWVFKHFPLNIHPQAPAAGVAAECAAEQGEFWEMHHLLFETTSQWSNNDPNSTFVDLAADLQLDVDAFEACLEDPEMMARVEADFAEGRPFVQGTPTFIVMTGEQGRIIPGALPAESFVEALEGILSPAE
jgi:protein-disulfide isomerase